MSSPQVVHGPWFPTSLYNMAQLSKAMNMFSMLLEMLEIGGPEQVPTEDFLEFAARLGNLAAAEPINPFDIRASGVLGALQEIISSHSKWPFAVRSKAGLARKAWELKFGPKIFEHIADWSYGSGADHQRKGSHVSKKEDSKRSHVRFVDSATSDLPKAHRMLNLPRPITNIHRQPSPSAVELRRIEPGLRGLARSYAIHWTPSVRKGTNLKLPVTPVHSGSLVFKVGDWWPGPSAAAKDGIIKWRRLPSAPGASQSGRVLSAWRSNTLNYATEKEKTDLASSPNVTLKSNSTEPGGITNISSKTPWMASAITFDEFGAYAVLFFGDLERSPSSGQVLHFVVNPEDPGRKSLMKNLRTQDPVRVLRSCKQTVLFSGSDKLVNASLPPRAGIRYDGLYKVKQYSIRLTTNYKEVWHYEYLLQRDSGQKALEEVLHIPTQTTVRISLEERFANRAREMLSRDQCIDNDFVNDDSYWGITKTALELWRDNEHGQDKYDYARAQRDFALAAVERIKSNRSSCSKK